MPVETKPLPAGPAKAQFVRTKIPQAERIASVTILVLLAAIAAAIAVAGRNYDPARYTGRADALSSTAGEVAGKEGTVPGARSTRPEEPARAGGESEGYDIAAAGAGTSPGAAPRARSPLELNIPGLDAMGETEFYNNDNLYEKINGRAPAYQGFNFQDLRFRSFEAAGSGGAAYIDIYEYRMDTPVNAFGIYGLERDPAGQPLDFVPDGYRSGMGIFFRRGACYVQILASDPGEKTMALAGQAARALVAAIPEDDDAGLEARRRLPVDGLDPASVEYIQSDAQGQAFLKNVFQAKFKTGAGTAGFFVMVAPDEAAAAAAWEQYRAFCQKYGKVTDGMTAVGKASVFQGEAFGGARIVYVRGREVGGIFRADDPAEARQFVETFLSK